MKIKIKRINKNYYNIVAEPICSCFLDEDLMLKAINILHKYKKEIDILLQNNPTHLIKQEWSLCYPYKIQTSFYGTNSKPLHNATEPKFKVEKVKNLFYIGDKNIYSKEVKNEIEKIIEKDTTIEESR